MPTRKRKDRFERILEALAAENGSEIHELAAGLGVSEMTIRRDLEELAGQGRVKLVHAGAVLLRPGAAAPGSPAGAGGAGRAAAEPERRRIGQKAASLVEAGDIIFVD